MELQHNPKLTSAEIAMLWNTYVADSAANCILKHFLKTFEDINVEPILKLGLDISQNHMESIKELFHSEGITTPAGFDDSDVFLEAPRLFSDITYLRYLHHMGRSGLNAYSLAKAVSARKDVRKLYKDWYMHAEDLFDMVSDVMEEIGVLVRSPYTVYPTKVEYVTVEDHFLGGLFKDKRPLLALEIAHIGTNIEVSNVAKTLLMGFSQVAQLPNVSDFFKRGYRIAEKHVENYQEVLRKGNASYPSTWDSTISESTVAPFSDRLMMFHTASMCSIGIMDYGLAIGNSYRKDLLVMYEKNLLEIGTYAGDGANIMIEHGWFEKPPQLPDREDLRTQK